MREQAAKAPPRWAALGSRGVGRPRVGQHGPRAYGRGDALKICDASRAKSVTRLGFLASGGRGRRGGAKGIASQRKKYRAANSGSGLEEIWVTCGQRSSYLVPCEIFSSHPFLTLTRRRRRRRAESTVMWAPPLAGADSAAGGAHEPQPARRGCPRASPCAQRIGREGEAKMGLERPPSPWLGEPHRTEKTRDSPSLASWPRQGGPNVGARTHNRRFTHTFNSTPTVV